MTSGDVREFLVAAGDFLAADPVAHTLLLTEAAYLDAAAGAELDDGCAFGWWVDEAGAVAGAFLRAPRHPPVLTPVPAEALPSLVGVLGEMDALGVDGRDVERVASVWLDRTGVVLVERFRVALCRLVTPQWGGNESGVEFRRATVDDRELLVGWFHELMAANPGDPSDLGYVIDDPLRYGGLTLWEVGGRPVAMCGRSRVVAGMTRVSAAYAPDGRTDAVFAAACAEASQVAEHVLVLTTDVAAHRALGFEVVLDRVTLEPRAVV
ncbi:hypothetical protein OWR29_29465 [Actinoplanes sp. Pm04-4]|uniref:N-acetyltransferase domain-containing protein n=1 Tax=Paractinoplanes pyxinae TaxID=2997416 RepID=A0ABT4B6K7_9ACTN|nr:hypothetical protein [Actinoplanes pyxinae]MCY1142144.1 hypothetical protein [Actinoplanes pyxinae]